MNLKFDCASKFYFDYCFHIEYKVGFFFFKLKDNGPLSLGWPTLALGTSKRHFNYSNL